MGEITVTKTMMASLIGVILYVSGRFNDLFWIFCICMLIDYITGYLAAWITHTKNSRIGLAGIFKKIMYMFFVVFGFMLDLFILRALEELNITFSFSEIGNISLGVIIMIFYIGNETISICENFEKIGFKVPSWMFMIGHVLRDYPSELITKITEGIRSLSKKDIEVKYGKSSNQDKKEDTEENGND